MLPAVSRQRDGVLAMVIRGPFVSTFSTIYSIARQLDVVLRNDKSDESGDDVD